MEHKTSHGLSPAQPAPGRSDRPVEKRQMSRVRERTARHQRIRAPLPAAAILFGLAGLPVAVWLDLPERMLETQAGETGRIIDALRSFYAGDGARAVNGATGRVITTHACNGVPNAIPIPAALAGIRRWAPTAFVPAQPPAP